MRVYIPHYFYYNREVEGSSHTTKQTGKLDPVRATRAPDYWIDPRPVTSKQNKTVIITDWTLGLNQDLSTKREILLSLLNEIPPFEIYFIENDKPILLTKENLFEQFNPSNIPYFYEKLRPQKKADIDAILKNHKLTPDTCVYLDSSTFTQLQNPVIGPALFNVSDLLAMCNALSSISEDQLLTPLMSFHNKLVFIDNELSRDTNPFINEARNILTKYGTIETKYTILGSETISNSDDFLHGTQQSIEAYGHVISKADLKTIIQLNCDFGISLPKLQTIVQTCPNLKILNISHCTSLSGTIELERSLLNIETINASNSNLELASLEKLLNACPALKTLYLRSYQEFKRTLVLEKGCLANVEFIDAERSNLNLSSLETLLQACPNLKKIILDKKLYQTVIQDSRLETFRNLIYISTTPTLTVLTGQQQIGGTIPTYSQTKPAQKKIDADTTDTGDKKFNVVRKITALEGDQPEPSRYRLGVYNDLRVSQDPTDIKRAFTIHNAASLDLKPVSVNPYQGDMVELGLKLKKIESAPYYIGKDIFTLSDDWQPLPSLTPYDNITHIQLDPHTDYELSYSEQDNLYYIRGLNKSPQAVSVSYLFKTDIPKLSPEIPREIIDLQNEIKHYGNTPLQVTKQNPTGKDYLDAIIEQKTGACRHRAVAFKALTKQYPTRIVLNDCHAYGEVYIADQWIEMDLGGYAAELNITESIDISAHQRRQAAKAAGGQEASLEEEDLLLWEAVYQTLLQQNDTSPNPASWHADLLSGETKKTLVETHGEDAHHTCLLSLYQTAKESNAPVFLVENPDDLYCSSNWIKRQDERGLIQRGPGGALYDFLTTPYPEGTKPVVLIDYARFKPQDIIRFNNLLDETRKVDGVTLPENITIIGVQNIADKNAYRESDFRSRFSKVQQDINVASEDIYRDKQDATSPEPDAIIIDLHRSQDWRQRLVGGFILSGQRLVWEDGVLLEALRSGKPVVIKNGPDKDVNYHFFWKRLAIDQTIDGKPVDVSRLTHSSGYDWSKLATPKHKFIAVGPDAFQEDQDSFLLNNDTINQLFPHTFIEAEKGMVKHKSLLETAPKGVKELLLTESLNAHQWAAILDEASQHQCTLHVMVPPGVSIPDELRAPYPITPPAKISMQDFQPKNPSPVIYSTDSDTTIYQLKKLRPDFTVIPISELDSSDLIKTWDVTIDEQQSLFCFREKISDVLKALQTDSKASFILQGPVQQETLNALLPLLKRYPGQLIVVSDDQKQSAPLGAQAHHVSLEEKLACVPQQGENLRHIYSHETLESLSLPEMQALSAYQQQHPENRDVRAPWRDFYALTNADDKPLRLNPKEAKQEADTYLRARYELMMHAFQESPFVFLAGKTGVGKSTFIERHVAPHHPVHFGEESIDNWLKQGGFLFIDEANITQRDWSEFEGLFQHPPTFWHNGKLHPLSPEHKVIFAGNPLNYGGSRHQASLFQRHAGSVLFSPLPPSVIYQEILKPIFSNTRLASQKENLSEYLLEAYQFIVSCSKDNILVTPRQLKSVAMLTIAECDANPHADAEQVLCKYCRAILRPCLVEERDQAYFDECMPAEKLAAASAASDTHSMANFLVTPSRQPAVDILTSLLKLRDFKHQHANTLNDTQAFGDLCSVVLESMPGLGKTELLKALMEHHGIQEADVHSEKPQHNAYYLLPVTFSFEEKKRILRKAFHEGNIVIMDEINSSPMMERFINALLTGKIPAEPKAGEPATTKPTLVKAEKPGFLLLGTQNPKSLGGSRQEQTDAQKKRMIQVNLEEYPANEVRTILTQQHHLHPRKAETLVKVYEHLQQQGKNPNLRNLLTLAKYQPEEKSYNPSLAKQRFLSKPVADKKSLPPSYPTIKVQ